MPISTKPNEQLAQDGKRIVSVSSDNTIHVWDAETGAALRIIEVYTSWVNSVAFSHLLFKFL